MNRATLNRRSILAQSLSLGLTCATTFIPFRRALSHTISKGALEIVHPWTFEIDQAGGDIIIGMEIRHTGARVERLLAAETFEAEAAEIKSSTVMDGNFVIEVPPSSRIDLHSGGPHILLRAMKTPHMADTYFSMALLFEQTGVLRIDVNVEERRR